MTREGHENYKGSTWDGKDMGITREGQWKDRDKTREGHENYRGMTDSDSFI